MKNALIIAFLLFFILDQLAISTLISGEIRFLSKTILLPLLAFYYLKQVVTVNRLFFTGLIFSFLGDLFLLFSWGFIAGLGSFLTAHVLYIFAFRKWFKKHNLWLVLLLMALVIGLISFLFPYLGNMKIPVIAYAVTIATMLYVAVGTGYKWLIYGAFFFVLSDTILAFNLFYQTTLIGQLLVMITYCLAQFLLVKGMIGTNSKLKI